MMRIYSFTCSDSTSDDGHVEVEILDESLVSARKSAREHLTEMKRDDLIPHLRYNGYRPVPERGVLSSNVQS